MQQMKKIQHVQDVMLLEYLTLNKYLLLLSFVVTDVHKSSFQIFTAPIFIGQCILDFKDTLRSRGSDNSFLDVVEAILRHHPL